MYPFAPLRALAPISQTGNVIALFSCFTAEHFFFH